MIACANALRLPLADQSVHCVVTSPPYWGLRDYCTATWEGGDAGCDRKRPPTGGKTKGAMLAGSGNRDGYSADGQYRDTCPKCHARRIDAQLGLEPTPDEYVANMVKVFREVWRVLRDDGTVWLNLGDSYTSGGRPDRDTALVSRSSGVTNRSAGMARADTPPGLKPKDLVGIPWRVAFALQADGWYLRSDIIWAKPNPMPESCTDRPGKAHEYVFLLSKRAKYFYDAQAIAEEAVHAGETRVTTAKSFAGQATGAGVKASGNAVLGSVVHIGSTRNRRTVWTIATQPYSEAHFATFPEKLVEPCVLAGTSEAGCCEICGAPWKRVVEKIRIRTRPGENTKIKVPGGWDIDEGAHGTIHREGRTEATYRDASEIGNRDPGRHVTETKTTGWDPTCDCDDGNTDAVACTVLDPFGGSGTTVLVAEKHNRRGIGFDLSPDYCRMARDRVGLAASPATWRTDDVNTAPLFEGADA